MPFYDSGAMKADAVPLVDRIALGAILMTAGARAMISFAPIPVFDMDPAIESSPFVGATLAQSVLLDALALSGAAWLLIRSCRAPVTAGRRGVVIALLCLPAILVALAHSISDADQLWRASTWIAAIASAVAILSRKGDAWSRLLGQAAIAALAGLAVVIAVRGLAQMTSEHEATVFYFRATRDTFLNAQGWLANSPQALTYERRLMQNEATGWFGFANVFATLAAGSAVLIANLAIGRAHIAARAWLWTGALLSAGLVVVSGSKGGVAALALGLICSVACRRWNRVCGIALVALPLIALGAIIVRGMIGSEIAEQSLLFRWYYLVGGARSFLDSPWMGVGPSGFQSAFMHFRPHESVEEVVSAHGAFADWMITLGAAGIGLIAFQLSMAWWSAPQRPTGKPASERAEAGVTEIAVASVVFAAVISIAFEAPSLDNAAFFWRLAGLGAGAVTAWVVVLLSHEYAPASNRAVGVAALAAVVLTHGQIDMVFWLPGSALWAWVALAVAAAWNGDRHDDQTGAARAPVPRLHRLAVGSMAGLVVAVAIGLVFVVSPALQRQDQIALSAAAQLNEDAKTRSVEQLAAGRANAAALLAQASQSWPRRSAYAVCAAEQWQAAASAEPVPMDAVLWLRSGRELVEGIAGEDSNGFAARIVASTIAIREAEYSSGSWQAAETALRSVIAVNHRHTESWIRLAGVLRRQGNRAGARDAILRALEVDETFAGDPMRQFSAQRRELIETELRALD